MAILSEINRKKIIIKIKRKIKSTEEQIRQKNKDMFSKTFKACFLSNPNKILNSKNLSMIVSFNKSYGNLKDQDRIFTNLYRDNDPFIKGAIKRVRLIIFIHAYF